MAAEMGALISSLLAEKAKKAPPMDSALSVPAFMKRSLGLSRALLALRRQMPYAPRE